MKKDESPTRDYLDWQGLALAAPSNDFEEDRGRDRKPDIQRTLSPDEKVT
jgi:hypothetical protein